jgi:sodium-dependent dicarboxylate transporter 2/3/5
MRILIFPLLGPVSALAAFLLMQHHGPQPAIMAGIVAWMAIWWISEAVPIPVTSLLPLVLYPLFEIETVAATASNYGREIIFLFLGGFIIALGIERSGAHRRIALNIMAAVGTSPGRLILGIMVACAVLSMWINSTAATLVMLPIALSLIDDEGSNAHVRKRMTIPLLLAVAYGATIGGMATPVGTPPNLILIEYLQRSGSRAIGFAEWMSFGVPFAVIYMLIAWVILTRSAFKVGNEPLSDKSLVKQRLVQEGRPTRDEIVMLTVFGLIALAWITGDDLQFSENAGFKGWRSIPGLGQITDAAIAIVGAIILFLIPSGNSANDGKRRGCLMEWPFAENRVPWGVLLLIGGGFALAAGVDKTGLSAIIGNAMGGLSELSPVLLIGVVVLIVCILSELGSNTATASLVIPILAGVAGRWGMDPEEILIPATLGASLGFMLPVASPMQTIVFGTGRIKVRQMVRAGVWMDLAGVILLAILFGLLR